jgi:hypothetical protein
VSGQRGRDREPDRLKAALELPVVTHVMDSLKPVASAQPELMQGDAGRRDGTLVGSQVRVGVAAGRQPQLVQMLGVLKPDRGAQDHDQLVKRARTVDRDRPGAAAPATAGLVDVRPDGTVH